MKSSIDDADRQIIPRWRNSAQAASSPDLLSHKNPTVVPSWRSDIDEKIEELRSVGGVGVAADLANAAILENRQDALVLAASVILDSNADAPEYLQEVVRRLLLPNQLAQLVRSGDASAPRREEVANIRKLLRVEPRNPVLLMDLARLYASSGLREKAELFARQAVALAPNSRWVLRSTSKLLSAHGKHEEAHKLLAKAQVTPFDPWLIAAEIATAQAAERSPKFWRQGQSFLVARSVAPFHLSELASAVGTIEIKDGKLKKAKERFQQSLLAPTENTLAQMKWAEGKLRNGFQLELLIANDQLAYEAAFRTSYHAKEMSKALTLAHQWMADEPFAPEPVANVTYIASLLDDYETAISSTDRELHLAGTRDVCVMNNRIYALLSSGKAFVDEAFGEETNVWLANITRDLRENKVLDVGDQVHALANIGLFLYRSGEPLLGRDFYTQAAELARRANTRNTEGAVQIYHAREAILAGSVWAIEVLETARKALSGAVTPGPAFYFEKIERLAVAPEKAAEILSPASLSVAKKASKSLPFRVEKTDKGLTLWVSRE